MNDFLQSLRNGNHKRFDGNRKHYNGYNNRGNDRQRGKEGRQESFQRAFGKEYLPVLKQALGDISENQKRIADAGERRALAEERKADALETIARRLVGLVGSDGPSVADESADGAVHHLGTDDAPAETPEMSEPSTVDADKDRVLEIIDGMRRDRVSYERIAAHLSSEGIPTLSGKGKWRGQTVSRVYQEHR